MSDANKEFFIEEFRIKDVVWERVCHVEKPIALHIPVVHASWRDQCLKLAKALSDIKKVVGTSTLQWHISDKALDEFQEWKEQK